MGQESSLVEETEDVGFVKKKINEGKESVKKKIINSPYYQKKFKEEVDEISEILSNKKKLLDTYLNTNWLATQQFQEKIESILEKDSNSNLKSDASEEDVQSTPTIQEIKEVQNMPDFQLDHEVKIKFIVAEIIKLRKRPITKAFYFGVVTPFMTYVVQKFPDFGVYHLALQVGPWIIEWNSSGLCIPRKLVSTAAILSHDVGAIATKKNVEETVSKLADEIIRWNTKIQYCKNRGDAMDCLKAMDIKVEFHGPMKRYIDKLMVNGSSKLEFATDQIFDAKFGLKHPGAFVFKTHYELDEFVLKLLSVDPDFANNYSQEYSLLKSFDRALWLRHIKLPKDKKYFPAKKKIKDEDGEELVECVCPFKDPRESKSFIYLKEKKDDKNEKFDEETFNIKKEKKK